ncbi:coat protein [Salvia hispanica RNA virus 1]|uniref:coat protein n=1 Tax=Salvia hispanica RNA virus 1 TaxID=2419805 RepID=UPI000EB674D6|nr:coat protein [Salvia hispanica RNA virus 1]AYE67503.1 coat protein [Salvia hispanica RNA virus 1]WKW35498.1 putative coat protein [Salvia hispanica RNA virus 1]
MAAEAPRRVLAVKTPPNYDEMLTNTLAPLAAEAFPVHTWTRAALLANYLDIKRFIDHVKVISGENDPVIRTAMIRKGNTSAAWNTQGTCTASQMFKFCAWLKSPEGNKFITTERRKRNIEKRAFEGQQFTDSSANAAMEAQITEHAMLVKKSRATTEETLLQLRREIARTQQRGEADIKALEADFAPGSAYVPMDDQDLGRACHQLYLAQCQREDADPEDLTEEIMADIKATFGSEATARHRAAFIAEGHRRQDLLAWTEAKVQQLAGLGDLKRADTFRVLVEGMGGELSAQERAAAEARAVAAGGLGPNRRRRRADVDPQNIIDHPRRRGNQASVLQVEAPPPPVVQGGDAGSRAGSPSNPPTDIRIASPRNEGGGENPDVQE